MKINNPLKRGTFKIGEYNNFPIYYSSTQKEDSILVGKKEKTKFILLVHY